MKQVFNTILTANADASRTSLAWNTNQLVSASLQFFTADVTAAGTLKVQVSNDNPNPSGKSIIGTFTPTNWADLPNATSVVAAGVGPAILIPNMCFAYIRVVFTRTGGAAEPFTVQAYGLSV